MIVMPSNNTCWLVHYWAGKYGNVGHLISPARRTPPFPHIPYALDNGAFSAWKLGVVWDERAFRAHVEYYAFNALRPSWVVVPDVVADARMTLARWDHWGYNLSREYHIPLALAVQDGMTPSDVRALTIAPDVVFVGGTTEWKWQTMSDWCQAFPRVHVGRVNTDRQLALCLNAGAESVDGTGWFRGKAKQLAQLGHFLREQAQDVDAQDVELVVFHSRLKHKTQPALPLRGGA